MHVGFDITPITAQRTGVGNYCLNLLRHLVDLAPEVAFTGFSSGSADVELGTLAAQVEHRHVGIRTRLLYASWQYLGQPKIERFIPTIDVYHATNFFLPPSSKAHRVLTVHDLAFLVHPELCNPRVVGPFSNRALLRRFATEADAILTYSESTRRDVVEYLGADETKVTVAPIAPDIDFRPVPRDVARHRLEPYGLNEPYVLFVGAIEPRKNVSNIVRAFSLLAKNTQHRLVLVGPSGWKAEEVLTLVQSLGLQQRIVRPGFVPQQDLSSFYSAADCLLFPTRHEGFGLPILEAMACGCPVVTSDNSSLREVAGDAALFADCNDVEGIAAAARTLVEDSKVHDLHVERGFDRVRLFSWDSCARKTLEVYRKLAQDS